MEGKPGEGFFRVGFGRCYTTGRLTPQKSDQLVNTSARKMNLLKILPFVLASQVASGTSIYFSYLGMVEGMDALGNPISFQVGGFEPGHLTFSGAPSVLNTQDITDFSFTASILDIDYLGNPIARIIAFDNLLFFEASLHDGSYAGFTLISETTFSAPPDPLNPSGWSDGQVFRFSAFPDLSARLEAVSDGSTSIVTEGTVAIVPEPSPFALISFGFVLLGFSRRRGRNEDAEPQRLSW